MRGVHPRRAFRAKRDALHTTSIVKAYVQHGVIGAELGRRRYQHFAFHEASIVEDVQLRMGAFFVHAEDIVGGFAQNDLVADRGQLSFANERVAPARGDPDRGQRGCGYNGAGP